VDVSGAATAIVVVASVKQPEPVQVHMCFNINVLGVNP
jgi:hypothetical protein